MKKTLFAVILVGLMTANLGAQARYILANTEATPLTTMQNAATTNAAGSLLTVTGRATAVITVTIAGTATVTFQGDNGSGTFGAIQGTAAGSSTAVTTTTASGTWIIPVAGFKSLKTPISGCSGCTVTVIANAVSVPYTPLPTSAAGGTSSLFGSSFPASGTAIGVMNSTGSAQTFLKADPSNYLYTTLGAVAVPPNALQTAANSDTVACPTDTKCVVRVDTGSYTDHSSTITTGGTSQVAIATNANRKHAIIQNPCSATATLVVNVTTAASTSAGNSFELGPCMIWETPSGTIPLTTEAINVTSSLTSLKFIAKEQ